MAANRRKKVTRRRAHTTHGFGSMKKNRGAGNRGGRGHAGSGKRADGQKPTFRVKLGFTLGKNGFGKRVIKINAVNIKYLEEKLETLTQSGIMTKKGDVYSIDLNKINVNKLLGTGKTDLKFHITVQTASKSAIEKIEKAGGKVIVRDMKLDNLSETKEKPVKEASEE